MVVAHTIIFNAIEHTWLDVSHKQRVETTVNVHYHQRENSQCITMIVRWMVELKCEKIVLTTTTTITTKKKKRTAATESSMAFSP